MKVSMDALNEHYIKTLEQETEKLKAQVAMLREALLFEHEMRIAHNFKPVATTVDALSETASSDKENGE